MRAYTATLGTETDPRSPIPTGWKAFEETLLWRPGAHPDAPTEATFTLEAAVWGLDGSPRRQSTVSVTAPANASREIELGLGPLGDDEVISLRGGAFGRLAAACAWREPFKTLALPDPGLVIARSGTDTLSVSVVRPAKGVWLNAPGPEIDWSDNFLDLCPGHTVTIQAPGLGDRPVSARWLGDRPRAA